MNEGTKERIKNMLIRWVHTVFGDRSYVFIRMRVCCAYGKKSSSSSVDGEPNVKCHNISLEKLYFTQSLTVQKLNEAKESRQASKKRKIEECERVSQVRTEMECE